MLIYNVVFEVPKLIETFAFRIMYEKEGKWKYFPGSVGHSNTIGEKRHATALALFTGQMADFKLKM